MNDVNFTEVPKTQPHFSLNETIIGVLAFLGQRLAFGLLVLLAIIFLTYFGLDMARGVEIGSALTQAVPKTTRYVGHLLAGDLGMSTAISSDVLPHAINELLPGILQKSFGLLGISLLFSTIVGVALGVIAATRRSRSLPILLTSIIGISAPSFFIALLLQLVIIRWTAVAGKTILPVGGFGWDKHLILPALVLAARPIAQITRITYLSIREILERDFVRTAHSKGLHRGQVLWGHAFRNAGIPILTTVSLSLRFSLSSLPVVEFFFAWPGVGFLLLKSISQQDDNLTLALLLSLGIFFILINLLLEAAYRFIDPRLRDTPEHITSGERQTVQTAVAELWQTIKSWRLAIKEWQWRQFNLYSLFPNLRRRSQKAETTTSPRPWHQQILNNTPFLLGGALVTGLMIIFLFGPSLAPHSPYTTQGLKIIDGEFIVPPFEPGAEYSWGTDVLGRDILSLILAGAQQTLILAALVVLARFLVGFLLGSLAGWWNGSWLDRAILGLAEMLAAFPTLLLTMILILAFGIREGFRPFLIALCTVGWGEMMQFVRSQVITLRPKPFIESAIAAGAATPRIITRHILPNLLSALISLAALEMGAVLMLLGELGFIGIFIGGGAFAELDVGAALYHYSDVPEWGSLLSNIRPYARSYSWTAIYPTLAFFVAILGFNLFGEGIRRLFETIGVRFTRLLNRYTLVAALVVVLGIRWLQNNTGAIAFYKQQAAVFDGQNSLTHVTALTDPAFDGRSLGSDGRQQAAQYIADQFAAMDLQAAGEKTTYFQPRLRDFEQLTAVPQLTIHDNGPSLTYQQDYIEFIGRFRNMGQTEQAPIRFIATGELTFVSAGFGRQQAMILQDLDLSQEILMVLSPEDARQLDRVPRLGTLIITDEATNLNRRFTLSTRDPVATLFGTGRQTGQDTPELWINEETADRLLQGTDNTVSALRRQTQDLKHDELLEITTSLTASMIVTGTITERVETAHVIGHLPGTSDELDSQLILVMAQYDTPPIGPDGTIYPAANDNASGIALMLELIRTMQESGYQPYKTFLFVAYSGEGQEGGNNVLPPDVLKFLQAKVGFSSAFDIEAVIDLRGVGGGEGKRLSIAAGGSLRLVELLERSAEQMNVPVERAGEPVDLSVLFENRSLRSGGQEAPQVGLQWSGWETTARTARDTEDVISADNLQEAGRALSLALMIMGRETQY